jgi:acyl-CoA thioester hydrolase
MPATTFQTRVIYGDTDQSGVVYHANFIRWFEAARCEYLRVRSGSYGAMTAHGVHFPVVEVVCRYHRPARFEDLVEVEVEVTEMKRATVRFEYRVRANGDPAPIATGHTLHGCTGEDGRLKRIPDDVRTIVLAEPR